MWVLLRSRWTSERGRRENGDIDSDSSQSSFLDPVGRGVAGNKKPAPAVRRGFEVVDIGRGSTPVPRAPFPRSRRDSRNNRRRRRAIGSRLRLYAADVRPSTPARTDGQPSRTLGKRGSQADDDRRRRLEILWDRASSFP